MVHDISRAALIRVILVLTLGVLLQAAPGGAATYVVRPDGSGDYPNIQAAINASASGDVIELTDGTFTGTGNRDVDFGGKAVTVRSQSGVPESCVIDCESTNENPYRGFLFVAGEGPGSVLRGLTITHALVNGC
jgi:hypothetical protein